MLSVLTVPLTSWSSYSSSRTHHLACGASPTWNQTPALPLRTDVTLNKLFHFSALPSPGWRAGITTPVSRVL